MCLLRRPVLAWERLLEAAGNIKPREALRSQGSEECTWRATTLAQDLFRIADACHHPRIVKAKTTA